jgi:DNA-directed RNA polymerase specialized sigma subunit
MTVRLSSITEAAESPAAKDRRLYDDWKEAPLGWSKDQAFDRLMKNLEPAVMAAAATYRAAPVPTQTMELEAKRLAGTALKDWNPTGGMTLASYLGTVVRQRLYRWVTTHQNVARIPEAQVGQIGHFQMAVNNLASRYGREATADELAEHMGTSIKHVSKLRKALRADLISSAISDSDGDEGSLADSIDDIKHDPDYERTMLAYYNLTEQEKLVFDYSLGSHGHPKLKPGAIATQLKLSPARISALKESIGHKLAPYLRPE